MEAPILAEFWIQAEPGGDTNNLIVGLTASGVASLTGDLHFKLPDYL